MVQKIYNTLTRLKEPLETIHPDVVLMYVCGPTVYDKAHVGHAMSTLVYDILRRYLEYQGYEVQHVMNYTDVDDKVIIRANELGVDPLDLAEEYIKEYASHIKALNVLPATVYPRATQEIPKIISMVEGLIDGDYAYPVDGDVFYRVARKDDYGKLSGRKLDEMQAGARIDVNELKENPLDFVLWKSSKPGEPSWDSPWGQGRPGWHIECSAMNLHHLGEQIDIHGGGTDLIFPHHENEIAQTESLTRKPFARYWVHNGMLQFSGDKMSKSLGNIVSIEDFLDQHDPDTLRMMVLNASYRSPLTFNEEVIAQAESNLERLRSALRPASREASSTSDESREALKAQVNKTRQGFIEAMDDDFNTAGALGLLFELVRGINQARDANLDQSSLDQAQNLLRELAEDVFGLRLERAETEGVQAAPFIDLLVELRRQLREQKQWELSDQLRDQLAELGVLLEDSKDSTTWRWK
ncbi:MAG: cysteine--tRNA ligase [Chloroflexota bacterium]|nr:MAG: cysteine--tRNA ligase [Chloroflexota bacterium]